MRSVFARAQRSVKVARNFSTCSPQFPGSPAGYTETLGMIPPPDLIPVYRVTDNQGKIINKDYKMLHTNEELVNMYEHMVKLTVLDRVFYDMQRHGRISFYMQNAGEEATHIGCASAFDKDDMIFAQYREAGVLLWRGFPIDQFAHQCFGNQHDLGKGRQMPIHYGSKELNFQTISSPLGTQIPQAVGAAYAYKNAGKNNIVVCFFGEGAASEGDFHAGLNFAATLEAPVMFFCRNNGYAISTPTKDQYRGDGIAIRALGLGIHTIRVDGNDLLAVHEATKLARDYILREGKPALVETYSYRIGHHSTSDDSTRYRDADEIANWAENNNPMTRVRNMLEEMGLWNQEKEEATQTAARTAVLDALNNGEVAKKPAVSQLFEDVYDQIPHHLREQMEEVQAHLEKYGDHYNLAEYAEESEYVNPAPIQK